MSRYINILTAIDWLLLTHTLFKEEVQVKFGWLVIGPPEFTFLFEPQVQASTSSPLPTTCPRPTISADPALGLLQRQGAVQIHQPDERL